MENLGNHATATLEWIVANKALLAVVAGIVIGIIERYLANQKKTAAVKAPVKAIEELDSEPVAYHVRHVMKKDGLAPDDLRAILSIAGKLLKAKATEHAGGGGKTLDKTVKKLGFKKGG